MVNMMQGSLGAWRCGKCRTLETSPQTLFSFFGKKTTRKIAIIEGGRGTFNVKPPLKQEQKLNLNKFLTITILLSGG